MEAGFITPMTIWGDIGNIGQLNGQEERTRSNGQAAIFTDVFKMAINQVKETQADVENKQYLLSTGQLDNPVELSIALNKAQASMTLFVTLRDKTLNAYSELSRINL